MTQQFTRLVALRICRRATWMSSYSAKKIISPQQTACLARGSIIWIDCTIIEGARMMDFKGFSIIASISKWDGSQDRHGRTFIKSYIWPIPLPDKKNIFLIISSERFLFCITTAQWSGLETWYLISKFMKLSHLLSVHQPLDLRATARSRCWYVYMKHLIQIPNWCKRFKTYLSLSSDMTTEPVWLFILKTRPKVPQLLICLDKKKLQMSEHSTRNAK